MYSPWTTSTPCLFTGSHSNFMDEFYSSFHTMNTSWKSNACLRNSSANLDLSNPFNLVASSSFQSLNNLTYYPDQARELTSNHFEPLPFFETQNPSKQRTLPQLSQKHTAIKQMIARKEKQPTAFSTHRSHYNSYDNLSSAVTCGNKRAICTFCKSNGESASVFTSHVLRNVNHEIQCPVLLAYVCPKCGATGKSAHTIKYCTALSEGERVALPTVKLFREGRSSSGKKNLFKK